MLLADVRDWLKNIFPDAQNFYCGKLENKKEKSVGVYQRRSGSDTPTIAIGGLDTTKTHTKQVSILLHWNKNATETEQMANMLYNAILSVDNVHIGNFAVPYISLDMAEPVDVGTDNYGVYERVIWLTIYYQEA